MQDKIIILDLGSQYTQLIARRLREVNIYCEILPYNNFKNLPTDTKGIILSGSFLSIEDKRKLEVDLGKIRGIVPVLGIDYGALLLATDAKAKVSSSGDKNYGKNTLKLSKKDNLLDGVNAETQVWIANGEKITEASTLNVLAEVEGNPAVFKIEGEDSWGILFHPEVNYTDSGLKILENFAVNICKSKTTWTTEFFIENTINNLKKQLGNDKVILALSGGVDSSVLALLLHKAIGDNLKAIFVNHGLLRKNEFTDVLAAYKEMGLNVTGVDASEKFYADLKGVTEPEQKRKVIGRDFIEVFDEEAKKFDDIKWLAQGTIYPDIIESVSIEGLAVKSHHNVGGLPDKMKMKLVEPLNLLFKDEVRRVGKALGLNPLILYRHPFPGPGLGVRLLGEITPERIKILQEADYIFIKNLREAGLYDKIWQAGVILLPVNTVGVTDNKRTYENAVALRAVNSVDGMTADWIEIPYELLGKVSNEIINNVVGVNRVVYDISSKPPATIEWE